MPKVPPHLWRKWHPTKKAMRRVLAALDEGVALTSHQLADRLDMQWMRVCQTLNLLMVMGAVSLDVDKFRREG